MQLTPPRLMQIVSALKKNYPLMDFGEPKTSREKSFRVIGNRLLKIAPTFFASFGLYGFVTLDGKFFEVSQEDLDQYIESDDLVTSVALGIQESEKIYLEGNIGLGFQFEYETQTYYCWMGIDPKIDNSNIVLKLSRDRAEDYALMGKLENYATYFFGLKELPPAGSSNIVTLQKNELVQSSIGYLLGNNSINLAQPSQTAHPPFGEGKHF